MSSIHSPFSTALQRLALASAFAAMTAQAQSNLSIYTDNLVNGFQDWSWAAHNLANTSPVHSGSYSISVTDVAWTGISFYQAGFNSYEGGFNLSGYTNFSFWANGGSRGGQQLQMYVQYGATSGSTVLLSPLPTNSWRQYAVPLSTLGVAGVTNAFRFNIVLTPVIGSPRVGIFLLRDTGIRKGLESERCDQRIAT